MKTHEHPTLDAAGLAELEAVDAALAGGTGGRPDDAQEARIRSMRDAHEADMLRSLQARPPAAFVFLDSAPLLSDADA